MTIASRQLEFTSLDDWENTAERVNKGLLQHIARSQNIRRQLEAIITAYEGRLLLQDVSTHSLYAGVLTLRLTGILCTHSPEALRSYHTQIALLPSGPKRIVEYNPLTQVELLIPVIVGGS